MKKEKMFEEIAKHVVFYTIIIILLVMFCMVG